MAGVAAGFGIMNIINQESEIILGERENWGNPVPFGISTGDRRQHVYIIGKTGSGKTTLLKNTILQDLALDHGVGVIDPHGDLAEGLLDHIPPWRMHQVAYFNPSDVEFPIAMNLLAQVPKDERHLVASGIVGALRGIWRDSWGPRMEYILYNALAALLDSQNVSLLGVSRMLTDDWYRSWVVRQVKDPFIRSFWQHEYTAYDERFRREAIAPIQNKLGQFLLNPVARDILGQIKCKIRFPFIIDDGRIFIANLSKGKIGDDKANLIGSLLVTQFQLAAMRRANVPEAERRDFYLFIDEFFNFGTDAFAALLAEARKYRLCLTLAHQYVDQLSSPVRQAALGNAGTVIVFRVGYSDAELLHKELGKTLSAPSLASLGRYEAAVNLLQNGANPTPFLAKMLPESGRRFNKGKGIINSSRRRFATQRAVVEDKLSRFMGQKLGTTSAQTTKPHPFAILENS